MVTKKDGPVKDAYNPFQPVRLQHGMFSELTHQVYLQLEAPLGSHKNHKQLLILKLCKNSMYSSRGGLYRGKKRSCFRNNLHQQLSEAACSPGGGGVFKKNCTGMLKVEFRISTISIPREAWFCDPSVYQIATKIT